MKQRKKHKKLIIILIIYIFTITTGYALFNGSLNIGGNVSTAPYYDSPYIPLTILPTGDGRYHSFNTVNCGFGCLQGGLNFYNEEIYSGMMYLRYKKAATMIAGRRQVRYYITIKNNTVVPFKNGTITWDKANTGDGINNIVPTISKTTINPGEECVIDILSDTNFGTISSQEAPVILSYEVQGKPKTYTIMIGYKAWNE